MSVECSTSGPDLLLVLDRKAPTPLRVQLEGQLRDMLVATLAEHAPGVPLTGLAAGFPAVAHLPDGADEQTVVARARRRRVGLYGMRSYCSVETTLPAQLVLGFGNPGIRTIREGIAIIAPLLR